MSPRSGRFIPRSSQRACYSAHGTNAGSPTETGASVPLCTRAYAALVERFQDMAVGYAYALLGDLHLAQDVIGQAYRDLGAQGAPDIAMATA